MRSPVRHGATDAQRPERRSLTLPIWQYRPYSAMPWALQTPAISIGRMTVQDPLLAAQLANLSLHIHAGDPICAGAASIPSTPGPPVT
jgi:hypothetical protein